MRPSLLAATLTLALHAPHATCRAADPAPDFRVLSAAVADRLGATPKHFRQLEPALLHLAERHATRLAALPQDERLEVLVKLAQFLDEKRDTVGDSPVIAPGRRMIGLLDPARGLDPKEITAIADGYAATATIFKQADGGQTIRQVADAFLAAVEDSAAGTTPTTIVVLGHGAPEEIQSYSISFTRLADAFLEGACRGQASPRAVNLAHIVLVCDDCYSADFLINFAAALEQRCRSRDLPLASLPACIAGTNRNCVGHADVGEKFVPHFWRDVIELFYVRRPRPEEVTLRDFFEKVDNMMYGYGRAPSVAADGSVTYRLVDERQCQDPVVFISLDERDLATLRAILGLPADAPLPRLLDIG